MTQNDVAVAFGEIMASEHRMDLWMLASPLVPRGFATPENPQMFRPLTLACPELDGTVNVRARQCDPGPVICGAPEVDAIVGRCYDLNRIALDRQPALNVTLEGETLVELGHGWPPARDGKSAYGLRRSLSIAARHHDRWPSIYEVLPRRHYLSPMISKPWAASGTGFLPLTAINSVCRKPTLSRASRRA
jgi:hypothetical protein